MECTRGTYGRKSCRAISLGAGEDLTPLLDGRKPRAVLTSPGRWTMGEGAETMSRPEARECLAEWDVYPLQQD